MPDGSVQESRTEQESIFLPPPSSPPTASPDALGASPPLPCSNKNPVCRLHALLQALEKLSATASPSGSQAPSPIPPCNHNNIRRIHDKSKRSKAKKDTAPLASSRTPSSNHNADRRVVQATKQHLKAMQDRLNDKMDRLRETQEKYRQLRLDQLRKKEQRLNERTEDLKLQRRRMRLNGVWDGELKAYVGKKIMQNAMARRDLKEEIKEMEGAAS